MIRHLVAIRFQDGVAEPEKADLFAALADLRGHLSGIADYQVRGNVSPEDPVVHGFKDLFWFDFHDAAARDAYLADPDHQRLGKQLVGLAAAGIDDILVLDFEV